MGCSNVQSVANRLPLSLGSLFGPKICLKKAKNGSAFGCPLPMPKMGDVLLPAWGVPAGQTELNNFVLKLERQQYRSK
jgi:hypothetical protein